MIHVTNIETKDAFFFAGSIATFSKVVAAATHTEGRRARALRCAALCCVEFVLRCIEFALRCRVSHDAPLACCMPQNDFIQEFMEQHRAVEMTTFASQAEGRAMMVTLPSRVEGRAVDALQIWWVLCFGYYVCTLGGSWPARWTLSGKTERAQFVLGYAGVWPIKRKHRVVKERPMTIFLANMMRSSRSAHRHEYRDS